MRADGWFDEDPPYTTFKGLVISWLIPILFPCVYHLYAIGLIMKDKAPVVRNINIRHYMKLWRIKDPNKCPDWMKTKYMKPLKQEGDYFEDLDDYDEVAYDSV